MKVTGCLLVLLVISLAQGRRLLCDTPDTAKPKEVAYVEIEDQPGLPHILLIGDSISVGYTLPVRQALQGQVNVHRVPANAGPSRFGLTKVNEWLGNQKWDLIHFNFGLHDVKREAGVPQVSVDQYIGNLRTILKRLKATGAKLVWASTTPIPNHEVNPEPATLLRNDDVKTFNVAATKIMEENEVTINDLYSFCLTRLSDIQIPMNLHFTQEGSIVLGQRVAAAIMRALGKPFEADPEALRQATRAAQLEEMAYWQAIEASGAEYPFEAYLRRYTQGRFTALAKKRLEGIRTAAGRPKQNNNETLPPLLASVGGVAFEFVTIPPGEFLMGSMTGGDDEKPLHAVSINQGLQMGRFEVTQEQWQAATGSNPSRFQGANMPVDSVSWNEVQQFLAWLNKRDPAHHYRLPTEAEWEYACRAGSLGPSIRSLEAMAWYSRNSDNSTHPVGRKKPNAWGLYDMYGNVWEWCQDYYDPNYYAKSGRADPIGPASGLGGRRHHVLRGCGIYNLVEACTATARFRYIPEERYSFLGFRFVRTPQ